MKNNIKIKGLLRITSYKTGTDRVVQDTGWFSNKVVINEGNGVNILVKNLIGDDEIPATITQAKIGVGDTAPTNEDTDLEDMVLDNIPLAKGSEEDLGIASIDFFVSDAELPEGQYKEFGIFCEDRLFARSVISPSYKKSVGEDTKIEYKIIINNT